MTKTPRITLSISIDDQKRLEKVIKRLSLRSPGQLMQMLLSGDAKRLEWIFDALKDIDALF